MSAPDTRRPFRCTHAPRTLVTMRNSRVRLAEAQARNPVPTLTIHLRYRGEARRLQRLDGTEIPDVPATETGIEQALRKAAGPMMLVLETDGDGEDRLVVTLGDPPSANDQS